MIFGNKPEPLAKLIDEVIESKGWQDKLDETKVPQIWDEIVGEKLSKVIKVINVENGIIYVKTDSSTWNTEIRLRAEQIIEKVNGKIGKQIINEIKLR
jgi:predicted nucleic acid-binding Zn ribbon protein